LRRKCLSSLLPRQLASYRLPKDHVNAVRQQLLLIKEEEDLYFTVDRRLHAASPGETARMMTLGCIRGTAQ
jgi:hypothetical protein